MRTALISRRGLLKLASASALGSVCAPRALLGAEPAAGGLGCVGGQPTGEKVGMEVLASAGNAIDAVVAAAVAAPASAGIGGFGMSAVIAYDGGKRVVAIDGNSAAPAAMRADVFRPGPDGRVPDGINPTQWLSITGCFRPACRECWPGFSLRWIVAGRAVSPSWFNPPSPWRATVLCGPRA